jgi:hypothetical protein
MRGVSRGLIASLRYCARRENLRSTLRIALAVGVVLTAINEGDILLAGHVSTAVATKIPLNFLTPLIVANLGLLAGRRRTKTLPSVRELATEVE